MRNPSACDHNKRAARHSDRQPAIDALAGNRAPGSGHGLCPQLCTNLLE